MVKPPTVFQVGGVGARPKERLVGGSSLGLLRYRHRWHRRAVGRQQSSQVAFDAETTSLRCFSFLDELARRSGPVGPATIAGRCCTLAKLLLATTRPGLLRALALVSFDTRSNDLAAPVPFVFRRCRERLWSTESPLLGQDVLAVLPPQLLGDSLPEHVEVSVERCGDGHSERMSGRQINNIEKDEQSSHAGPHLFGDVPPCFDQRIRREEKTLKLLQHPLKPSALRAEKRMSSILGRLIDSLGIAGRDQLRIFLNRRVQQKLSELAIADERQNEPRPLFTDRERSILWIRLFLKNVRERKFRQGDDGVVELLLRFAHLRRCFDLLHLMILYGIECHNSLLPPSENLVGVGIHLNLLFLSKL